MGWVDPWGLERQKPAGYKFPNSDLHPNYNKTYEIYAQGSRKRDNTASNRAAGIKGKTPTGYTWHHVDYDPKTGKMTMQLVEVNAHSSIPHKGGVSTFKKEHALDSYNRKQARELIEKQGNRVNNKPLLASEKRHAKVTRC